MGDSGWGMYLYFHTLKRHWFPEFFGKRACIQSCVAINPPASGPTWTQQTHDHLPRYITRRPTCWRLVLLAVPFVSAGVPAGLPALVFPTLNVRRFSSVLQPWLLYTARAAGGNEVCLGLLTIWDKSSSPGGPEGTWERSRREEACSWQLRTTALNPGRSTQKALCGSVQCGASNWVLGQKGRSGRNGELWIKPAV